MLFVRFGLAGRGLDERQVESGRTRTRTRPWKPSAAAAGDARRDSCRVPVGRGVSEPVTFAGDFLVLDRHFTLPRLRSVARSAIREIASLCIRAPVTCWGESSPTLSRNGVPAGTVFAVASPRAPSDSDCPALTSGDCLGRVHRAVRSADRAIGRSRLQRSSIRSLVFAGTRSTNPVFLAPVGGGTRTGETIRDRVSPSRLRFGNWHMCTNPVVWLNARSPEPESFTRAALRAPTVDGPVRRHCRC